MLKKNCMLIGGLLALGALTANAGHADDHTASGQTATAPSEQMIEDSLKKLIFVPHDSGAPEATDTGGVRAVAVLPKVELLAPERMARTLSPTPTLYWHISKAPLGLVRFTLIADDPSVIDPLLEVEVKGVDGEGIYGVNLEDYGITLDHGQRYVWSVSLSMENDNHGSDVVAQSLLEHAASPDLSAALANAAPADRALRLAAEGYWYDAIEVLSVQIESGTTSSWQAARARLLDQTGLLQAARFDKQQSQQ